MNAEAIDSFVLNRRILVLPNERHTVAANPIIASPAINAPAYVSVSVPWSTMPLVKSASKLSPTDEYEIAFVKSEELLEIRSLIRAGLNIGKNAAKHTQTMNILSTITNFPEGFAV
jgi:hypothetical protein